MRNRYSHYKSMTGRTEGMPVEHDTVRLTTGMYFGLLGAIVHETETGGLVEFRMNGVSDVRRFKFNEMEKVMAK